MSKSKKKARAKKFEKIMLLKARRVSRLLNWSAGISAVWTLFYPKPYEYALFFTFFIPIIAFFTIKYFKGVIRLDEKGYPSVKYAFAYPIFAILMRFYSDYSIFNYSNAWFVTIIITISFFFLMFINQEMITFNKENNFLIIFFLIIYLFIYSFGAVIFINCNFDNFEPQKFTAKILNKRISAGKITIYYLKLAAWGPQKECDEVSVSSDLYKRVSIDNKVNIYLKSGKLYIPWYVVTDENRFE